jgi:glycosyltransferase involved in cell wall biosynthesis
LDHYCDAINLIASDMASELQLMGFSGRNFSHIPNGIPVLPLGDRRAAAPITLIAVGRLSMQKGYDILLAALARIPRDASRIPWRVWIVGDGPERDRLHALVVELGLADVVTWWGEQPVAKIAGKLESAHVFLLPSRYEGMSNAGLEAMERGLPVVATRCGGLDLEIDERMGWVVPTEDVGAFADAIASALACGPAMLARMGNEARQCVEAKFDMKVVSHQYLALFERLGQDGATARNTA